MGRPDRPQCLPADRLDIHMTPLAGARRRVTLTAQSERFVPVIERLRHLAAHEPTSSACPNALRSAMMIGERSGRSRSGSSRSSFLWRRIR